ncbi:ABC transporter substrate-binding protein [Brucella pseudogrignonensis]|uniref:Iron complex transport system substrate-binding protein n=1 Tax=Brucella pseudogrignonensis TaxID=419475 RepID=A0ABU1M9N5_9HYPH|nr:ABC transporter substrate-binding protein [Brucella pseudogrignonensis]MDR6432411.1 iron complex transport system substrate-binding protein [Brucella pseudogrignonensis]
MHFISGIRVSPLGKVAKSLLVLVILCIAPQTAFAESHEAKRIVSLGPDVTEIIFALGAGDKVIAVDRSSKYPAETANKTNVGYRRSLSPEGILALNTDLIIASEDIGPPETTDVLNQSAVEVFYVPVDNSREGLIKKIGLIAKRLGVEKQGEALTQTVIDDFDAATAYAKKISADKQKKVVFFHGLARLSGAGSDTAADAFIRYAGGTNPLSIYSGYKPVSEEWLVKAEPDVVLMLSDGAGGPTREDVFSHKALQETPAARSQSLVVLEGPYMLGFGPRTAEAIRKLAAALYE